MHQPYFLSLSSEDRLDYNNTDPADCQIRLSTHIENAKSFELVSFMMPNSYYNITSSNNTFETNLGVSVVDEGNYTLTEYLSIIENILSNQLIIAYNDVLSKVQIEQAPGSTISSLNLTNYPNFASTLGLKAQTYNSFPILSDYPPKIYENELYIYMNVGAAVLTSNKFNERPTFIIPNNTNKSEIIQFYANTQYMHPVAHINHQLDNTLHIRLRDKFGNKLKCAADWTMTFYFCS